MSNSTLLNVAATPELTSVRVSGAEGTDFTIVANDNERTSVVAVATEVDALAPSIGVPLRETFNTTVPAAPDSHSHSYR